MEIDDDIRDELTSALSKLANTYWQKGFNAAMLQLSKKQEDPENGSEAN